MAEGMEEHLQSAKDKAMVKSTTGSHSGLPAADVIELPVLIKTLVIDGKRLTSSVFKQIAPEGIIDEETGEVRGTAIGWLNTHQKDCPSEAHLHVLWTQGSALRLSTVLLQVEQESAYLERQEESLERRQDLLDLLAYCLAPTCRSTEAGYDHGFDCVSIGKYKLPLSQETRALLSSLEEAREQYDEDLATCQQGAELPPSPDVERFLQQARELRASLSEQQVRLAHPRLYKHKPRGELEIFEVYDSVDFGIEVSYRDSLDRFASASPSAPKNTRATHDGWFVYSDPAQPPGAADTRKLYWRMRGTSTDGQAAEIEAQFAPHIALLRVLLAQQAVQIDLQNIQAEAVSLAIKLNLIAEKQEKSRRSKALAKINPAALNDLYQQEREQFAAFAERWQRHVVSFQELDQLFIVS